jgi:hypothetical protein
MHRKLLTLLVAACALGAVVIGPATASAATLGLYSSSGSPYSPDPNTSQAYFEADATSVSFGSFTAQCGKFSFTTDITQNHADPVILDLRTSAGTPSPALVGCPSGLSYSNIQFTAPIEFNADGFGSVHGPQIPGTGTLPLRITETWSGASCVREGTLNLTYFPSQTGWYDRIGSSVSFDGYLQRVSGSLACPTSARFQGSFDGYGSWVGPTDETGTPIEWIVTP